MPFATATLFIALFASRIRAAYGSQKTVAVKAGLPNWMANGVAGFNAGVVATPLSVTNTILAPVFFSQGWAGLGSLCIAIPGIAEVIAITTVLKWFAK